MDYLVCFIVILSFADGKQELGLSVVVIGLAFNFVWAMVQLYQKIRAKESRDYGCNGEVAIESSRQDKIV